MERHVARTVEDLLTAEQIDNILSQAVGDGWLLVGSNIKPAALGISGFLGDHFRVTFDVTVAEGARKVNLFVKSIPLSNKPKAKFIAEHNYYKREMIMFQMFEKFDTCDSNPWFAKAYICNDRIVVMPDLLYSGYRQLPSLECLDLKHTLLTTASIARFHAAFANYETMRTRNGLLPFYQEYANLLTEPSFYDSPYLHAAAKLTKNFLTTFSDKCHQYPTNLEKIILKLYVEACNSLTESDSLNVVNHKDLWINNIMFKYEGETPLNALLIDFQCIRYGPPAFDIMIFLYLNTTRSFRKKYESMIFRHYYAIFSESLDYSTKERLKMLCYDFDVFVGWCHRARMFGMVETLGIFPFVLMDPGVAKKTFDDPETFTKYCNVDRTEPVVAHARDCVAYKKRQLEVGEEFVERYVLKQIY